MDADERAEEALDHLQAAALEFIAAVRAVLDIAEEAVREPQALADVVTSTVRAVAHAASSLASPPPTMQGAPPPHDAPHGARDGGVEHIPIS
jgi:hypothetical protein